MRFAVPYYWASVNAGSRANWVRWRGVAMSGFGSDPRKSGFNEITKEYKASPTIENYVRLRRQNPDEELEIATTGGIEFLFHAEQELLSHGISPGTVAGVLDADLDAQSKLSLKLLALLIERRERQKSGATHTVSRKEAISDTLVNYLIGASLDALSWNDELEISRELIVLIKHQLGSLSSAYEFELDKREKVTQAKWIAAQFIAKGEIPTYRQIGRVLGVQASTVMRWFPDGTFISEAKALAKMIEEMKLFEGIRPKTSDKE